MASDDPGDEAKGDAILLIDVSDLETDGIQLTGHLLGMEQLCLCIDAHLKAYKYQLIAHASNDTVVVGARNELTQVGQVGILGGSLDG